MQQEKKKNEPVFALDTESSGPLPRYPPDNNPPTQPPTPPHPGLHFSPPSVLKPLLIWFLLENRAVGGVRSAGLMQFHMVLASVGSWNSASPDLNPHSRFDFRPVRKGATLTRRPGSLPKPSKSLNPTCTSELAELCFCLAACMRARARSLVGRKAERAGMLGHTRTPHPCCFFHTAVKEALFVQRLLE